MISYKFSKNLTWLKGQIWAAKCDYGRNFESYSFFRRCEVVVGKNIRHQTCCLYVLCYSLPLPCQGPKSNLHHLRKIYVGKHNGRANSKIGYWQYHAWPKQMEQQSNLWNLSFLASLLLTLNRFHTLSWCFYC